MSPLGRSSDLFRLNREAFHRPVTVDPWTYRVLAAARLLSHFSSGAFDVTLTNAAPVPLRGRRGDWRAIELLHARRVRFTRPVRVDLGGIAKGFAVDRAVDVLRSAAVPAGVVNAGGDLRVFGSEPELVHVRHPGCLAAFVPAAELVEEAMATSANYLDTPGQGRLRAPLGRRRIWLGRGSVSIRASSCLAADALCKVVAAVGPREAAALLQACGASALILRPGGGQWSEEFAHAA